MIALKKEPCIIIADDNPENLRLIMDILKKTDLHCNLIAVPNGKVLVEIALQKVPDLIITDWEMPVMNGLEALIELKKHPFTEHIPVIMCTGIMTTSNDLKTAMDAGAVDYVRKPVEAMELVARVQSMLRLSASYIKIKEQKEEIESQAHALEKVNEVKDKMFSIIAHDLRSPFNTLKGMLMLLELDPLFPNELKFMGKDIQKKVAVLDETLNNLLTWAMSQMQGEESEKVKIDVLQIVENKMLLFKSSAEQKNIQLAYQVPNNTFIFADVNHFRAILRNLINNAIKFTPEGGKITIHATEKGDFVLLTVIDTGVGMEQEKVKQIFTPKTNLSTLGTNNEKGTGLGMLICKDLVGKNNGNIYVTSVVGEGTTFFVELPKA
ncbi:MAG: hybrid sensor histidine kinase/response regulator [Bacteroidetes bacterium]|nr:MAG: hybrid sensor histidine kinase/response regulator [Bacteroidota bacterium]